MAGVEDIEIGPDGIRLGQLLKLANIAETGGMAKELLADGLVRVNGEVETRRGAQLSPGDVVACAGAELRLV
jgi:ribosome-associated protein